MIVVFDWDGTLCDSIEHIVSAMQAAAGELAVEVPDTAAVRDIIGLGLPQAVATLFPQLDQQQRESLAATYSRHYASGDRQPPKLFGGALETLAELRDRGVELGVATGKSRRGLDRILAELELTDFFDATRCADETRSKPDPLMLTQIMAERDKTPSQVIMVGDTEYDLDMASQAGVASVGVSFGVHSPERLARHAPLEILDELPQLLRLEALAAS
jgi:phosphoglycolate phosphatase